MRTVLRTGEQQQRAVSRQIQTVLVLHGRGSSRDVREGDGQGAHGVT